ncbi:MAG TPA: helix-turn-helix domain-containing protein, partial [Symbiobacteriaceae bacterium]|nr:helix-turn-helix domain-containing protein [Symbiobacteriaceae bacterium]
RHDGLGLRHMLLRSMNGGEVGALRSAILKDLPQNDPGGYFMTTLQALVAHDFEMDATAAALHVHRNTLRYRLRRLEEAIGMSLNQQETRFWLRLALELGPITEGVGL